MDKINLGKSDLKVSRIGIGGGQWGQEGSGITDPSMIKKVINHALDSGINFIDTAEAYGNGLSEKMVGEVLKERGDRENVVIASKVNTNHLGFDEVLKACHASLRRLQTDYIDLYQVHSPNPTVPISETMTALRTLLDDGLVKHVGVSNFQVSMTEVAVNSIEKYPVISNQMEYSLLNRGIEKAMLKHAKWREMAVIAYSPLARGMLTGKYGSSDAIPQTDRRSKFALFRNMENRATLQPLFDAMKEIADKNGADLSQVALNWLIKQDNIIPIPSAKSPEQVDSHVAALGWKMSDADWQNLSDISGDLRLNLFYNFGDA
ncbi:MAG: aldo/keto reductase [Thermoplasmata archaeon]|nr:aldo/keto reductase [Thermoplasmata archaeon]